MTITYGDVTQVSESKRTKGYLSATENIAHFGVGDVREIDKVTVHWLSGKKEERTAVKSNAVIAFRESEATQPTIPVFNQKDNENTNTAPQFSKSTTHFGLDFVHRENDYNDFEKEVLLPYKQSTLGPFMSKADVNGDGLLDIYIGGASGQAGQVYLQTHTGFKAMQNSSFHNDAIYEDMESLFVDLDGDEDQDLIVLSGGNEFENGTINYTNRYYHNNGKGQFTRISADEIGLVNTGSSKTIATLDFDQDGDQDIVIGNRIKAQQYPVHEASKLYRNDNGKLVDITVAIAPELETYGIVNKVIATDFNNDGWQDFIVVGEWSHIGMFQNNEGVFKDVSASYGLDKEKGWWFTIEEMDINKDGLPDYVVGNIGSNIKYKASDKKPFKVFGEDFDDNGTFDLVLSNTYNGNYVPARGKECSTQQMPFSSEKFETYNAFANATLDEIYGEKLETAYQREITTFTSKLLINTGSGFDLVELPPLAQLSPILSVVVDDMNNDGYDDILLAGTIYETEVETPRYDMGSGLVLLNNKGENFEAIHPQKTNLHITGNVKQVMRLDHQGQDEQLLLSSLNNARIGVYKLQED